MMPAVRSSLAVAALALSTASPALADGALAGRACETTSDCDEDLHCVEGVCVAVHDGRASVPASTSPNTTLATPGARAMFGDGRGYGTSVLVGDVAATASAGVLVLFAASLQNSAFAISALFPTTLTAPIIHLAHGRYVPALVSFLGWASVPATSVFLGFLLGFENNSDGTAFAVGTATALTFATGLTALDVYFARPMDFVGTPSAEPSWAPVVTPVPRGLEASIVGRF